MQNSGIKNLIIPVFLFCFTPILFSQGWFAVNTGCNRNFTDVFFVNQNTGYICGDTTLKTTDGGISWTFLPLSYTDAIHFFNASTGLICTTVSPFGQSVGRTTDGGFTWSYSAQQMPHTICFVNNLTGWTATGLQGGNIKKTTNGGLNWFQIYSGFGQLSTQFYDTNVGYSATYGGSVLKSSDGGFNWVYKPAPSNNYWVCIGLTDTNRIYMGSTQGNICRSTDGADTWTVFQSGTGKFIIDIFFVNTQTGYAVGGIQYITQSPQLILKTTNAGDNWFIQQGVTPFCLEKVFFINANTGWAVGDSGRVIKTTTGGVMVGIENEQNETPSEFKLNQNYPNPFNPSTTISYQVPKQSYVTLAVFDLEGRVVSIPVNKIEEPGYKSVEFNAGKLSSGVYYYRLQAADPSTGSLQSFTETKKLVLLK